MASGVAVAAEVGVIDLCADPSDRSGAAIGKPQAHRGTVEVRVGPRVQEPAPLGEQRRNPVGVVRVQRPRQAYEALAPAAIADHLEAHRRR